MIALDLVREVLFNTICKGSTCIPEDVRIGFEAAIAIETQPAAQDGLRNTYNSLLLSMEHKNPACPDTGWPLFYFKVGNECVLEGGIMALEEAARDAVYEATYKGYLRSTMKHPLTGYDPGNNIGTNIPDYTYRFVSGDSIEISYVAKGGGSECFGGTRHRVIAFADGIKGIEKFVVDSFIEATRSGGICPPNILGIGIGGTANIAANLAKEAACLRTIGSHHPEDEFRKIEDDLYRALNSLGIGVMGVGGDTSVLGVHVEYAYTHIAGIVVAISSNCMIARRATSRIYGDGKVEELAFPNWFGER